MVTSTMGRASRRKPRPDPALYICMSRPRPSGLNASESWKRSLPILTGGKDRPSGRRACSTAYAMVYATLTKMPVAYARRDAGGTLPPHPPFSVINQCPSPTCRHSCTRLKVCGGTSIM